MTLIFEYRPTYGRHRYYPKDAASTAVCILGKRAALYKHDLLILTTAGFDIRVDWNNVENIEWRTI